MTLALTTSQPGMKPAGRNAPTLPDNPWPMRRLYPVGDYRRGLQLIALEECDEVAAAHYARTALAALSAIEGGGGALQPSASVPTEQADGGVVGYDDPDFAPMTHAPDLERWAINQMPKAGWREIRLMRFDGTNLYQWHGKRGLTSEARDWSVFEDAATEVFRITPRLRTPPTTPIAGGRYVNEQQVLDARRAWDEARKHGYPEQDAMRNAINAALANPASDTTARYEPEASEPKDAARRDEEAGQ